MSRRTPDLGEKTAADRRYRWACDWVKKRESAFEATQDPDIGFQILFFCSTYKVPLPHSVTSWLNIGFLKRKQDGVSLDRVFGFTAGRGKTPPLEKPVIKARQFAFMAEMQTLQCEFSMSSEDSASIVAERLRAEVDAGERSKSKAYSYEVLLRLWRSNENACFRKVVKGEVSAAAAHDPMDAQERRSYASKYPVHCLTPEMRKALSIPS